MSHHTPHTSYAIYHTSHIAHHTPHHTPHTTQNICESVLKKHLPKRKAKRMKYRDGKRKVTLEYFFVSSKFVNTFENVRISNLYYCTS